MKEPRFDAGESRSFLANVQRSHNLRNMRIVSDPSTPEVNRNNFTAMKPDVPRAIADVRAFNEDNISV